MSMKPHTCSGDRWISDANQHSQTVSINQRNVMKPHTCSGSVMCRERQGKQSGRVGRPAANCKALSRQSTIS